MKILLDYDGSTITGPSGLMYVWAGLEEAEFKPSEVETSSADIVKLAGLGYSADDIVKLKFSGLL